MFAMRRTRFVCMVKSLPCQSLNKYFSLKQISAQASKPDFDHHKAFTESMAEHDYNLQKDLQGQIRKTSKPSGSHSSKAVSRFKMQRGSSCQSNSRL
ncbi:hypothetical protein AB3S75_015552 [Citrus x aurantiifolia]